MQSTRCHLLPSRADRFTFTALEEISLAALHGRLTSVHFLLPRPFLETSATFSLSALFLLRYFASTHPGFHLLPRWRFGSFANLRNAQRSLTFAGTWSFLFFGLGYANRSNLCSFLLHRYSHERSIFSQYFVVLPFRLKYRRKKNLIGTRSSRVSSYSLLQVLVLSYSLECCKIRSTPRATTLNRTKKKSHRTHNVADYVLNF